VCTQFKYDVSYSMVMNKEHRVVLRDDEISVLASALAQYVVTLHDDCVEHELASYLYERFTQYGKIKPSTKDSLIDVRNYKLRPRKLM